MYKSIIKINSDEFWAYGLGSIPISFIGRNNVQKTRHIPDKSLQNVSKD